jgi:Protein of unknown function (DUF1553)/Protein of unknown function (DUF1549)/Planctomycete cytochrome C
MVRASCFFLVFFSCLPSVTRAGELDFARDVAPIFEAHCYKCHGTEMQKGGIGLATWHHSRKHADSGAPLFVAGASEQSLLIHVVGESDPAKRMPRKAEPLSEIQITTLRRWIDEGGKWPDDGWRPPIHWAYLPPKLATLPAVPANQSGNEVDWFIQGALNQAGLPPNPPAPPAQLLRRVYLDLIGLPPSVADLNRFLSDPGEEAYAAVVDELLRSPRFGERWAVPWLDLARYADSEGYQRDSPRNMWPYRDWVITALNADMPFDQFTIEQLAGDLLPDPVESQLVATAFHRNSPLNLEAGTDPLEDHYKQIVDRVNTTSTIWLGSTMACAQCHNHKYDPFTIKEYYELFAFFNNTPIESRQKGSEMGMSEMLHIGSTIRLHKSEQDIADIENLSYQQEAALGVIRRTLHADAGRLLKKNPAALPEAVRKIIAAGNEMSLAQCQAVARALKPANPELGRKLEEASITADRLEALQKKEVRVQAEMEEIRPTFIAKRGDFQAHGEQVVPATPAALHHFNDDWPRNRLGLARWLVDPANPLVARAYMNRLWLELFGQGLVATPEEFGSQGEHPTHPELLDWLAVAFVEEDGWSLKKSLRRLVLSSTYRQSIEVNPVAAAVDPANQWLWRHPGHRLSAETIRDQGLALSGLMSERLHGTPSRPYQPDGVWRNTAGASETYYIPSQGEDAYRRGVYTLWRRGAHYPSFANFDAPDRSACVVKRDRSNTPLQALTLLNDPVYVEMAEAFGQRIEKEGGTTVGQRIEWAFRTALARYPRESEKLLLHSAYETVLAGSNSTTEACREVATILLNLHETINRS